MGPDEVHEMNEAMHELFKGAHLVGQHKWNALTAERDQLRAEVERLRENSAGLYVSNTQLQARAEAAERERDEAQAHAEDLRGALQWIQKVDENGESRRWPEIDERIRTVTARTPAQSLARIKAEALEEVSKELRTTIDHVMCGCYNDSDIGGLQLALAKVAQLGSKTGECLKCSYAAIDGKKVVYQRCADCDAEADRLEATDGR